MYNSFLCQPKKFNPACNHLIDVIWMCTKLFARPPISPQIAKNVFKGLGSRQILGESWVGRYPLPAAFSAENQKDKIYWLIMVETLATCKISMSSFCFLRVSSSSLILLSFSSSTPPQSRLFMLSLLSQLVVVGHSKMINITLRDFPRWSSWAWRGSQLERKGENPSHCPEICLLPVFCGYWIEAFSIHVSIW